MAIIAVTGLRAEARIAQRAGLSVVCAGGMPAHTAAALGQAIGGGALHARTGAVAVDLESAVVALAAAEAGLPFLVLRAIADPAERGLPAAARIRLKPDGAPDLGKILASLLVGPGQIGALIRLADDTRRALRTLSRAIAAARPLLAERQQESLARLRG